MSYNKITEQFITKSKQIHGNTFDYSNIKYTRGVDKINIKCKICSNDLVIQAKSHLTGIGCKYCGGCASNNKTFIKKSKTKYKNRFNYDKVEYINQNTKIILKCNICESEFTQTPKLHMVKGNCRVCWKKSLVNTNILNKLNKIHGDTYEYPLLKHDTEVRDTVEVICKKHDKFSPTLGSLLSGRGCKKCSVEELGALNRKEPKIFFTECDKTHNKEYDYSDSIYTTMKDKVAIRCKTHGNFEQVAYYHHQGSGCPDCAKDMSTSKGENELLKYIKNKLKCQTLQSDRQLIAPLELDIVLPKHNIAIEFNGVYWHSENNGKDKYYHKNKTDMCREQGYQLIHIFEDDWNLNKKKIKKYIRHLIGQSKYKPIYARKTKVVSSITSTEARTFLDKHHIQGSNNAGKYFGTYFENRLVGVASFTKGKSNTKNKDMYELTRYATCEPIVGGLGKIVKHFINIYNKTVYTFCDDSFFTGSSYLKAGFIKVGKIAPDYKYVVNGVREHKFKWRRKDILIKRPHIYSAQQSEAEMMKKAKIYRIWDCGKTRFELQA